MKALVWSSLVLCVFLCPVVDAGAQPLVGALAIDERQGHQYGWAVDYETASAAQGSALQECGSGCSVVLTFGRCAAHAADQDANSTAVGWAESYDSAAGARQAALSECSSRGGGSGCTVRVWGCNGPVVEEGLVLNRATRRQIQLGLRSAGFDPGGADGLFGPRTRTAIRNWQSRGFVAGPWLSADGSSSGDVRELGRRAGVCVVAEPDDGCDVSAADRGGMGTCGRRVSARLLRRTDGKRCNVPGRLLRFERRGSVGHARECD